MYSQVVTLKPNTLFINDEKFANIKNVIEKQNKKVNDFGSFICIEHDKFMITLSELYELEIYYNDYDTEIDSNIIDIEKIIKSRIKPFEFLYTKN